MDSKERIEALCGIIESLLLLIEDETAADCIREEYQNTMNDSSYERRNGTNGDLLERYHYKSRHGYHRR